MRKSGEIIDISKKVTDRQSSGIQGYNVETERERNTIGTQIVCARKSHRMSAVKLATELEQYGLYVSRQLIGKWEKGVTVPNGYQLMALCHALKIKDGFSFFSGIPVSDDQPILNQAGLDKLEEYKNLLIASGLFKPIYEETVPIRKIEKLVCTLSASAGTGNFLDENSFEKITVLEDESSKNADFGIYVHGDSMEPEFHDGQLVWVQKCSTLLPGEVGIFEYDGNGYIKEYQEQEPEDSVKEYFVGSDGTTHMQPVLVSFNKAYEPIKISPHTSFMIVGKIV